MKTLVIVAVLICLIIYWLIPQFLREIVQSIIVIAVVVLLIRAAYKFFRAFGFCGGLKMLLFVLLILTVTVLAILLPTILIDVFLW